LTPSTCRLAQLLQHGGGCGDVETSRPGAPTHRAGDGIRHALTQAHRDQRKNPGEPILWRRAQDLDQVPSQFVFAYICLPGNGYGALLGQGAPLVGEGRGGESRP
jgi:hypothetical protein